MGRVLAKRFFGNTNPGGISGESVASVTVGGTNNAYVVKPTITFAAPTLPAGVTAVGAAHMAVVGVTNFTAGSGGYAPAQVLTLTGGTGTAGTLTVSTTAVATLAVGSVPGTGYTTGDVVTIQGGTGTLATATVIANAGAVTGFSTYTPGSYTVNPGTLNEATTVKVGGGGDDTLTVDITMGVGTVAITTAGDYSVLPTDVTIVPHTGGGTGALFNLTFKVLSVVLSVAGSGYASAPTITESAPDGNATFVAVMTTTGVNGITAYAYTGGSSKVADIVKQTGSRRYRVTTADGTVDAYLKASAATAATEMTIVGTDEAGGTYFVTKLGRHSALITRGTGTVHATGARVNWSFDAADDAAGIILIQNA